MRAGLAPAVDPLLEINSGPGGESLATVELATVDRSVAAGLPGVPKGQSTSVGAIRDDLVTACQASPAGEGISDLTHSMSPWRPLSRG